VHLKFLDTWQAATHPEMVEVVEKVHATDQ
jgi:hypothetical protein